MATSPGSQRLYRAACPGCGAPVAFRSAHAAWAMCSYCHSTVVRDGQTLARIGRMAELFDDHSPLALFASGRWSGRAFTLVGRLQYRGPNGTWTEWHALFDDGSAGWLSEDNGAYVFALPAEAAGPVPGPAQLRLGATVGMAGRDYQVAFNGQVVLLAAEGELPKLPQPDRPFAVVELRSADGEVLSIDYGTDPPVLARGRAVRLEDLQMAGLREDSAREFQGRQFACPQCGAQVQVQLDTSKSVTCRACHSLIDVTSGIGGELRHAVQHEPVKPLIPLGSTGHLQGAHWQVVGFQHRLGTEPDDPDEPFGWDEYLLYNRQRGFLFLVDATDGWSLVQPATGAPVVSADHRTARYLGKPYTLQYAYRAQTTYVAGEFYWPVERGQVTFHRDYASGRSLLSLEEAGDERTWSSGERIGSDQVAEAFGMEGDQELLRRGDAGPTTPRGSGAGCGCLTVLVLFVLFALVLVLVEACDQGGGGGGSYRPRGTWSTGGSHK